MEGERWIDEVMAPLGAFGGSVVKLPPGVYNRIYEAVGRGNKRQGEGLVGAIVLAIMDAKVAASPEL